MTHCTASDASWFPYVGYGLPSLAAGHWWTPVTGAFIALKPWYFAPMVISFALLVGWAENWMGTRLAAAVTVVGHLFAVLGTALFLAAVQGPDWAWSVQTAQRFDAGFSAGAVVSPLTTTVYYIGVGSDGDSSLWRLEQVNGPAFGLPEELVPDIENMQVLYGIDPAGTQTAAAYVTADQVGGVNVVSIQVALLVASPQITKQVQPAAGYVLLGNPVTAPVDSRMRQVFYATINLRDAVN